MSDLKTPKYVKKVWYDCPTTGEYYVIARQENWSFKETAS